MNTLIKNRTPYIKILFLVALTVFLSGLFTTSVNASHQCVLQGPLSTLDAYDGADMGGPPHNQPHLTCNEVMNSPAWCDGEIGDTVSSDSVPCIKTCVEAQGNVNTRELYNCTPVTHYSCSGSIASNASAWDTDESSPTSSGVSWTRSASDAAGTYCQYECNSGYTWNGSSCVVTAPIPPAPTLSATPASCGTGRINLSWSASSGATSYTLQEWISGVWTNIYNSSGTSYSHTSLTAGSAHSYRVLATNSSGSSGWSSAVDAWAPSACTYSCTGTTPSNANLCSGDDTGLSANTAKSVVSSCTPTKCEYTCAAGYTNSGGTCVPTASPVNGSCGSRNGTSQTTDPSTWTAPQQCSAGTFSSSPADTSTQWLWTCLGSGGGSNASCSATDPGASGPTATIGAGDCTVASGASTCNTTVTWTSSNTIGTRTIRETNPSGTNTTIVSSAAANNSTGVTRSLSPANGGQYTYSFRDGSTTLASDTATASCASGTSWNTTSGTCQTIPGPYATIGAGDCTVASGASTCNTTVTWTSSNTIGTRTIRETNPSGTNTTIVSSAAANNSTGVTRSLSPANGGQYTYSFRDGSTTLASDTATASCASGTSWNTTSGTCQTIPTLPDLISQNFNVTEIIPGSRYSFIANSYNQGPVTTGGTYGEVFQYSLNSGSTWNGLLGQNRPALASNTPGPTWSPSAQSFTVSGPISFRHCTDAQPTISGVIPESDETNNCSPAISFTNVARPDLRSMNLSVSSGPYNQGQAITINANVRNQSSNTGTVVSFEDNFSYRWGATGTWIEFTALPQAPLAQNTTRAEISTQFTPNQSGTLYIQHCVDSDTGVVKPNGDILEYDESNNCTTSAALTVDVPSCSGVTIGSNCVLGSITANGDDGSTSIPAGDTALIEWTLSGAGGLSCQVAGNGEAWDVSTDGSQESAIINSNTFYTLSCSSISIDLVNITTTGGGNPTLTPDPRIVERGGNIILTYNTDGAVCTLSGGALGGQSVNGIGSVPINNLQATTVFTLSCPSGDISTRVEVIPKGFET